jgi:hypothetical protein
MSTEYTRYFSALAKYTAGDPVDDRDFDGELDAMAAALNKKVMIKATAPGSPINGQTWIDTTTKLLKWYRGTEWVSIASVHVAAAAMAAPQAGDLWYDTGTGTLNFYTGAGWSAIEPAADNRRDGLFCTRTDADNISVSAGIVYVGASRVSKTAATALAIGTAANWIGGVSLRAVTTAAYIYVNAAGDIKLHTALPDETDVAGNSAGTLRYRDFSGTYYRCIGWFYMNATGSGEISEEEVGNFRDGEVFNISQVSGETDIESTTSFADMDGMLLRFFASGNRPIRLTFNASMSFKAGTVGTYDGELKFLVGAASYGVVSWEFHTNSNEDKTVCSTVVIKGLAAGVHTIKVQWKHTGTEAWQAGVSYPRILMAEEL